MSRWIYGWILSAIGILVILVPACNQFSKVVEEGRERTLDTVDGLARSVGTNFLVAGNSQNRERLVILDRNQSEIIIGSWNIEKFGVTKMSNPSIMTTLVNVARQFDVLAIQEIQSKHDQTFVEKYVDLINADGSKYSYVLSPILGSNRYSEQYAFIYDTNRIVMVDEGSIVPDPQDLLKREPMFSRFRTNTPNPGDAFSFALANVHVAPNETRNELSTLYEVYLWLQSYLGDVEDDIILLGDFNEPPRRYGQLWQIESLRMVLSENTMTNTLQTKAYDNILFDQNFTQEFMHKSGVLDLQQLFGFTREQASDVSDHLPVWAAFSAGELRPPNQFARQPSGVR